MVSTLYKSERIENGKRFYTDHHNKDYISITTLLSRYEDQTFLNQWKAKVGEEEAERIKNAAAKRGTETHLQIEEFFEARRIAGSKVAEFNNDKVKFNSYASAAVDKFYSRVTPVREEDILMWEPFPGARLAGRFDQLIHIPENTFHFNDNHEGVMPGNFICDLKTKDKQPRLDKIDFVIKHLMQISTYAKMLEVVEGMQVNGGVVVFAVALKTKNVCRLIHIDKSAMDFYWSKVEMMLYDYCGLQTMPQTWAEIIDEASCTYDFEAGQFIDYKPREIS